MTDWENENDFKNLNFGYFSKGMINLWYLLGTEKWKFGIVIGLLIVSQVLAIGFPYVLKMIFDIFPKFVIDGTLDIENNYHNNIGLFEYLLMLILIAFVIKVFSIILRHLLTEPIFLRSWIKLENYWPVAAQKKLLDLSYGYHEMENTGKKIAKIEKGTTKLIDIIADLYWNFLPQVFFFVFNVIMIFVIDYRLGLIFLALFIPGIVVNMIVNNKTAKLWDLWEEKKEIGTGYFVQSLLNVKTVQGFVQEKREIERFSKIRKSMEEIDWNVCKKYTIYWFIVGMLFNLGYFLTILLSIYFVFEGSATIGTVVYVATTGIITIDSVYGLMHTYTNIIKRIVAVNRMKELFDTEIDIKNEAANEVIEEFDGIIKLDKVQFTYPGKTEAVLKGIDVEINPKEMVALVSRSGQGKTTINKLLTRMYDIGGGRILLDGKEIKDLDLYWYRRLFAIVQQDVDIFDTSLLENVTYSNLGASREQVDEAIKAAHLHELVNDEKRMPEGLETMVGERGVKLSGGERQRVGIARAYLALLNGAKFLVLDEATSNLDSEAERAIQMMIDEIKDKLNIAILAIAHRLSTIKKANMIYVVEDGKVIEQGNHDRLMQRNGLYSRLVEMQSLGSLRE